MNNSVYEEIDALRVWQNQENIKIHSKARAEKWDFKRVSEAIEDLHRAYQAELAKLYESPVINKVEIKYGLDGWRYRLFHKDETEWSSEPYESLIRALEDVKIHVSDPRYTGLLEYDRIGVDDA